MGRGRRRPPEGPLLPDPPRCRHWRERSKAGDDGRRPDHQHRVAVGLYGNAGQTNYGAAKAGIAA